MHVHKYVHMHVHMHVHTHIHMLMHTFFKIYMHRITTLLVFCNFIQRTFPRCDLRSLTAISNLIGSVRNI